MRPETSTHAVTPDVGARLVVEGLCVDTNITFSDLKGTLDYAMKAFFGSSVTPQAASNFDRTSGSSTD